MSGLVLLLARYLGLKSDPEPGILSRHNHENKPLREGFRYEWLTIELRVTHNQGKIPLSKGFVYWIWTCLASPNPFHLNQQIVSAIIFTVAAGLLCFAGALYTGTEIAPLLAKMDSCQYFPVENSCKCFHQTELRQVSIIFRDTANCNGIQKKLRDLVYGMSGVYSGGLVACIVAAVMETLLLCRKRNSKVGLTLEHENNFTRIIIVPLFSLNSFQARRDFKCFSMLIMIITIQQRTGCNNNCGVKNELCYLDYACIL